MFAIRDRSLSRAILIGGVKLLALVTAGAFAAVALADEPPNEGVPESAAHAAADREQAFWECDYVGTTYGVSAAPVDFCSDATSALMQQKFGGEFGRMLEWWRQNKAAQHARLEAASIRSVTAR